MSSLKETLCPAIELRSWQRFRETVCRDLRTRLVDKGDIARLNVVRDEVVADYEVLGPFGTEFAFEGHGDRTLIVLADDGWSLRGKAQFRE